MAGLNTPLLITAILMTTAPFLRAQGLEPVHYALTFPAPPSLAKREAERERAIHAYRQVNGDAIRRLAPGGILLSASCSAHVSAAEFTGAVRAAARESGRAFAELRTTGHPPDHPATFAEAQVLKAIYLRF